MTIVDLRTNKVIQQVGTGVGADKTIGDGTVAPDPPVWSSDGSTLWLPQSKDLVRFSVDKSGMVSKPLVINLQDQTNGSATADLPSGMALSDDGSKLYVALNGINELGVIDTSSNQLVQLIKMGNAPRQVVLVGDKAFVSNEGGRPATPADFTNQSYGTPIVASKVTGAAVTGTVSEVDLVSGQELTEIPVGLQPTAEFLAPDGTLFVANSNDDSVSLLNTTTGKVVQTVNVNPLPGSTVGSYPNSITMPDRHHVLVSIGRDNALALYKYQGPKVPMSYLGLLPTDFYPVQVSFDPTVGKVIVTNDRGIGTRGPQTSISEGPGTSPAPSSVSGHNTYNDTGSLTSFRMPSGNVVGLETAQVFRSNGWDRLLQSPPPPPSTTPVPVPRRLGDPSTIKHVFLIVRENRTYDQVFGDMGMGDSDPNLAQFGQPITPNAHALANTFGLFDNFYDEGTLSADGHNWLTQADANDYIEKEFGAFVRSYPASGADALAYQRNGFLWNAARAAGQTVQVFGEYNNFHSEPSPTPSWSEWYQDAQVLEGKAPGPLPVPVSSINTYSDIPSLNTIDYHPYPPFDLGIPDQYRVDVWLQAFSQAEQTGQLPNLELIWLPDDHTAGVGSGLPNPVAEVADNDLALGRMVDAISHSSFWPSSAIFVVEDDSQNGVDHVDGHRAPVLVISPWSRHQALNETYYTQLNVVRTIEQILGIPPMNQEDRAAVPMFNAFDSTADLAPYSALPNQIPLTQGLTQKSSDPAVAASWVPASPSSLGIPAKEAGVYEQWVQWSRNGRFAGPGAREDWANPAQLNRLDWYDAHGWKVPYPGDSSILAPNQVPGRNLPAAYLGND